MATREDYERAFREERVRKYPVIDAYERELMPAPKLPRALLEMMAWPLACPVKARPPSWQHGRVIYATAMRYIRDLREQEGLGPSLFVDIGTAKGFSALCLARAFNMANCPGEVISFDVIDPKARVRRNSFRDLEVPPPTLHELVEPFAPSGVKLSFVGASAPPILRSSHQRRIGVAFIDGKHTRVAVAQDAAAIATRQQQGDIIIFDDLQIEGVARAVEQDVRGYEVRTLNASEDRGYAIARKL